MIAWHDANDVTTSDSRTQAVAVDNGANHGCLHQPGTEPITFLLTNDVQSMTTSGKVYLGTSIMLG